jgi:hypothetical protein
MLPQRSPRISNRFLSRRSPIRRVILPPLPPGDAASGPLLVLPCGRAPGRPVVTPIRAASMSVTAGKVRRNFPNIGSICRTVSRLSTFAKKSPSMRRNLSSRRATFIPLDL